MSVFFRRIVHFELTFEEVPSIIKAEDERRID